MKHLNKIIASITLALVTINLIFSSLIWPSPYKEIIVLPSAVVQIILIYQLIGSNQKLRLQVTAGMISLTVIGFIVVSVLSL